MTFSIRNIFFATATLSMMALLLMPAVSQAQFELPDDTQNPGLATTTDTGKDSIAELVTTVTSFLAGLLAVLAILVIVVAGILYITSGGDEGRIASAKTWLTYAIIGLIIALLAWVIVNTVAGALGAG